MPGKKGKERKKLTVRGVTRDEALARYAEFARGLAELPSPVPVSTPVPAAPEKRTLTFAEFVVKHGAKIAARVAPRTAAEYGYVLRSHLLPVFGSLSLDRITSSSVEDFMVSLTKRGYAPATVNDYVNVLKIYLFQAVDREEIESFPLKRRVPRLRVEAPCLELSDEERARFLAAFDDEENFRRYLASKRREGKVVSSPCFGGAPRVFGGGMRTDSEAASFYFERFRAQKPLFVVALETGLRRGDLLSLRWSSVDLNGGWIELVTSKKKRPVTLPITEACRAALLEMKARPVLSEFVFLTEEGRRLSEIRVNRTFRLAKTLAKITRRLRFHDLRHTFASTLASREVSLQVIAKAMGHSTVGPTQRYARPNREALLAVKRALEEAWSPFSSSRG